LENVEERMLGFPQTTQKRATVSSIDILSGSDEDTSGSLTIGLERVEGIDNCLILRPKGQIDSYSTRFFQRRVKKAIDTGFINLIFILNSVDYVSSTGVGAFAQLQKAAKEMGGEIVITDVHPKVMEIFRLMCLDK
jgi:anti-anti-sigma factor